MRVWRRGLAALAAVGLACTAVPRYLWFRRGRLPRGCIRGTITSATCGAPLATVSITHGHPSAVIVAHGFLKCMRTPGIAWMMQRLATHYDVYALDFPGHGESGGDANLSFGHAGQDLACLVEHVRERGYRRVGVVGYSMGAAAAMYAAAQRAPIDAVAAICGPAGPPEPLAGTESWPTAPWRWWVRLMGTRLDGVLRPGPWPIEYVQAVTPVPLLIVHHEMDTLIRRADSEALYAAARAPKDYVSIPGALHAVPAASADAVMAWLERHLSDIDHAPYTESGQEARHVA